MLLVFALLAMTFVACDTTAAQGEQGEAGINGVDGKDGKDGIDGKDGANGKSAYELAVESGFKGSLDAWLDSLKGEDGKDGIDGVDGVDGKDGSNGISGTNGKDGLDGIGIKDATVKFVEGGYKLIFTLDNGETLEVPVIAPTKVETTPDTVTPDGSDSPVNVSKLSTEVILNDTSANGFVAKLPANTLLDADASEVALVIDDNAESNANITVNEDITTKKAFDIKVEGVSEHNDMPIIVTLEGALEAGLINVTLYHGDDAMTEVASLADVDAHNEFYYDAATGNLTIATISFSNFTYTHASDVTLSADGKTYTVTSANGLLWVEAQSDSYFSGKTVALGKDIDCAGFEMKPIRFWDPENRTVFDGKNCTLSNVDISSNPNVDNQALFNGTLDIKNLTVDGAYVQGKGYVAVLGGTIYGNIDNCTVKNATVIGSYWMAGAIAAQFNSGSITNCTVENSKIYSGSATAAIAGYTNETSGTRKFENITVKNCTIDFNGSFGGDWDAYFGIITGRLNISNSDIYFNNCDVENCTVKGEASDLLFGATKDDNRIYIDNVEQVAPSTEEVA